MNPRVEKILNLPRQQQYLILVAICAVVVALFWFGFYGPKRQELNEQLRQKETLMGRLEEDRRIAADLPRFKAEYERMEARLEAALQELPDSKEIASLLTSIADLARNNGLEVLEFKPGGEVPRDFYAEVPVALKLRGTYHEFAMFCYQVGNLPRIVNIGELKLDNAKLEESRNLLSVDCVATTFRFIEKAAQEPATKGGQS